MEKIQSYFDEDGRLKDIAKCETEVVGFKGSTDPKTAAEQALVFASMCGQVEVIRFLLDHGVDVNAHPPGSHWTGAALHSANDLSVVKLLVERGADAQRRDHRYHNTPVQWAHNLRRNEIKEYFRDNVELVFGASVGPVRITSCSPRRLDSWRRYKATLTKTDV